MAFPFSSSRPLFVLLPDSDRAMEVSLMEANKNYCRYDTLKGSSLAIGWPYSGARYTATFGTSTLATLGQRGDIQIAGSDISEVHCSFELNPESLNVLLLDRSSQQNCQFIGENAIPFQPGRLRRVVVLPGVNTRLAIGSSDNLAIFRLVWNYSMQAILENRHKDIFQSIRSSHIDRTTLGKSVLHSSRRGWATDRPRKSDIKYHVFHQIGRGDFGVVRQAVDLETGRWLAVKSIIKSDDPNVVNPEREILVHSTLRHPNIVEFLGWDDAPLEPRTNTNLVMPLMEGSLEASRDQDIPRCQSLSYQVLREMLEALDFLSSYHIVHRDFKPGNILYKGSGEFGQVSFFLSDFGLSNHPLFPRPQGGTPFFIAPELAWDNLSPPYAPNSDVWSLFVTILWINDFLDSLSLPRYDPQTYHEHLRSLLHAAQQFDPAIREMAVIDPAKRASAAQMLVKLFGGSNLTTARSAVPPLPNGDYFTQLMVDEIKDLNKRLGYRN